MKNLLIEKLVYESDSEAESDYDDLEQLITNIDNES